MKFFWFIINYQMKRKPNSKYEMVSNNNYYYWERLFFSHLMVFNKMFFISNFSYSANGKLITILGNFYSSSLGLISPFSHSEIWHFYLIEKLPAQIGLQFLTPNLYYSSLQLHFLFTSNLNNLSYPLLDLIFYVNYFIYKV